jgi:hypothetical protein
MVSSCGVRMGIPIGAMQVQYVPMECKGTLEEANYCKTHDIFLKVVKKTIPYRSDFLSVFFSRKKLGFTISTKVCDRYLAW